MEITISDIGRVWMFEDIFYFDTVGVYVPCKNLIPR